MRKTALLFSRLMLAACLALYAPFGVANAGGGVFMEICADGVVQTVRVDADGVPVGPEQACHECLTCCQATDSPPDLSAGPSALIFFSEYRLDFPCDQSLAYTKQTKCPMPRGPPLMRQPVTLPERGAAALDDTGLPHCSDGRPLFKDASA